jgi:hypothetical protein
MRRLSNKSFARIFDLSISLRKHYATGLGISMVVPASFLLVALWGEGSLAAAWRVVSGDWLIVLAVTTSVAVSTSIGSYARELSRSTSAMTCSATGSVTSMIAMVSCCLHHATDALAAASIVLGSSAVFLLRYRVEFVSIGLVVNAFGTGLMVRQILRYRGKLEDK